MPRSMRIQFVAGLVAGIVGLAVSCVGSAVVAFLLLPDLDPKKLENSLDGAVGSIAAMGQWSTIVGLGGLALSAGGFLYTFAVWADWFIGRGDAEKNPASSA
jgi:hypothetical protein